MQGDYPEEIDHQMFGKTSPDYNVEEVSRLVNITSTMVAAVSTHACAQDSEWSTSSESCYANVFRIGCRTNLTVALCSGSSQNRRF
ncbi:hypothetical protein DOTSEDRAFT_44582 [Dothistroma septosporum NZE10]|uniref:Uncharacterized protein n=1 Tax=Dothistroma septosporum (strain NZE10 / CBS 128990) TaxID=675120 RepID=N1PLV1_DOTSN|nr:hypothetical protein DOTSEDRAFT_44582 [Dothistroma septosporum NZE10]